MLILCRLAMQFVATGPGCVCAACMRLAEPFTNCALCLFRSLTKSMRLEREMPRCTVIFFAFSFSCSLSAPSSSTPRRIHSSPPIDSNGKYWVFLSASTKMIFVLLHDMPKCCVNASHLAETTPSGILTQKSSRALFRLLQHMFDLD